MPRFAANLSLMYTEHAFLDRFEAAAADGFDAVEFLFPYAFEPAEVAARLRRHGLAQALFNAPPGDWDAGERGIAALPDRVDEFRRGFTQQALPWLRALRCPRLHVLAGVMPEGMPRELLERTYLDNLRWAAPLAAAEGVTLLIEPLNPRDVPGYLVRRQQEAHRLAADTGAPNVKVQFDLYHCQIVEGDLATGLRRWLPTGRVGHIQIAGVPDRQEPDAGEVHYPYLFDLIDALGYDGPVGAEYRPRAGTSEGLGWLRRWRAGQE
ncbi:2-oxo-tetronate isomerase [Azohydromonas aeria]|uniref:2-oxo-tetronate isomerase n=1 Tax=Azohydromonas aeria TaxID=2590212 RepID=UPI0012F93413|nr:2-oxo-tetronate isomerase [Azohydromonas aeria]